MIAGGANQRKGKNYRSSLNLWLPTFEEMHYLVHHIRPPAKKVQDQQFILYSHPVPKQTAHAITRVLHEAGFDARVYPVKKSGAELESAKVLVPQMVNTAGEYVVFFRESRVRQPQYTATDYGMEAVANRAIRDGKLKIGEFVWISYIDPVFAVLRARVQAGIRLKNQLNGRK